MILIPFALLRVRELLKKKRSPENLELLKRLIQNDIIESINSNLKLGNITIQDAQKLRRYTHKLYQYVYSRYEEMEALNEMTDESLMLDIDIIEKKHEEELNVLKDVIIEKDKEIERLKVELKRSNLEV